MGRQVASAEGREAFRARSPGRTRDHVRIVPVQRELVFTVSALADNSEEAVVKEPVNGQL